MRNKRSNRLIVTTLIYMGFLSSCGPKTATPLELVSYVNNTEKGLVKSKTISDYQVVLQYMPASYTALKEFKSPKSIIDSIFIRRNKELKNSHRFVLALKGSDNSVLHQNTASKEEYQNRLNYYIKDAQSDFKLVDGHDTLACSLYHFERTYNLNNQNKILLSFAKRPNQMINDLQFIYTDRVLGIGKIKFYFTKKDLKNIPKLNISAL